MTLLQLVEWAKTKNRFQTIDDYSSFCEEYLSFIFDGLQAVIVSQNENHYRFFQYREDGNFNVTRPINSNLMISIEDFHLAVFLNDVQRKGKEPRYGINTTFLAGHFKGYTIKLNPLDGVYYCDLRPNMLIDDILSSQIRSLDTLLIDDIWKFIE